MGCALRINCGNNFENDVVVEFNKCALSAKKCPLASDLAVSTGHGHVWDLKMFQWFYFRKALMLGHPGVRKMAWMIQLGFCCSRLSSPYRMMDFQLASVSQKHITPEGQWKTIILDCYNRLWTLDDPCNCNTWATVRLYKLYIGYIRKGPYSYNKKAWTWRIRRICCFNNSFQLQWWIDRIDGIIQSSAAQVFHNDPTRGQRQGTRSGIQSRAATPRRRPKASAWLGPKRWIKWSQDGNGCEMGSGTSELVDYSVHFWDIHCREEGFNPHSDEHVRRWTRSGNCPSLKQVHHCPGSSQRVTQGDFEVQKMTGRWYITAGLYEASGCGEISGIHGNLHPAHSDIGWNRVLQMGWARLIVSEKWTTQFQFSYY